MVLAGALVGPEYAVVLPADSEADVPPPEPKPAQHQVTDRLPADERCRGIVVGKRFVVTDIRADAEVIGEGRESAAEMSSALRVIRSKRVACRMVGIVEEIEV